MTKIISNDQYENNVYDLIIIYNLFTKNSNPISCSPV